MLLKIHGNEYINLSHYKRLMVIKSPLAEGFVVVGELPVVLPTEEGFATDTLFYCESEEEAINFLGFITSRLPTIK